MATDALRAQVAHKWQDAFNLLNRDEPGISGLMTFSQVGAAFMLLALLELMVYRLGKWPTDIFNQ